MKPNLPDHLLSQLSEFIAAGTALHFPRDRWRDLERRTISAAGEFGFTDEEAFIRWLVSSPLTREQIEILASHLMTSETYFWREPQIFEGLREHILPELIRSQEKGERRLRIWSAGCATGEEPYSIAIALCRVMPVREDWHITILATDINPRILRKAKAGVYGKWSFRNAPPWLREEHFRRQEDGRFEILPKIREMVTFAYLNLAEDTYPSPLNNTNAMDIIFCRNVLMYFAPERARQVERSLYRSLVDGGWLMVAACELSQQTFPQFTSVHLPGAIVYQKDTQRPRSTTPFCPEETLPQETWVPPLKDFAAAAEKSPPTPHFLRGEMLSTKESPSPPRSAHPEALDRDPQERHEKAIDKLEIEESHRNIALFIRALANQGRLTEALAACEEAIVADKIEPELHYLRAIILQEQDREAEAIAALKHALYLQPTFVLAHFVLGNLVLRQGNRRRAKRCFENVLALLSVCGQEDLLPESEGLRADRLAEITRATMQVWG